MIVKKTINFEKELYNEISKLAIENERDFSGQVRFMLKDWMKKCVPSGDDPS